MNEGSDPPVPAARIVFAPEDRAEALGVSRIEISLTHGQDSAIAVAVAVAGAVSGEASA